jgi:hypothetical protein
MDPAMSRDSGLFWNKPAYSGLFPANSKPRRCRPGLEPYRSMSYGESRATSNWTPIRLQLSSNSGLFRLIPAGGALKP